MSSYILLRNNKESGPHNLAGLQELGLKPNDLIWVEGQSASWRNPGEIRELKELVDSPPVTKTEIKEQKPVETEPVKTVPAAEEKPVPQPEIIHSTKQEEHKPTKVFVAMPAGQKKAVIAEEKKPEPVKSTPLSNYQPRPVDYAAPIDQQPKEEKQEVETKYAMSLEEIKERYIKSLEQRKKQSRGFNFKIPKAVSRAAVYVGLVLVGALSVLLLTKAGGKVSPVSQTGPKLPATFETRPEQTTDQPGSYVDASTEQIENSSTSGIADQKQLPNKPSSNDGRVAPPVKKYQDPVDETDETDLHTASNDDITSIPKNEVPEIRRVTTSDIAEYVSVRTNDYTIAALGGIRNLELTISNDSKYHLDKVVVELRYLNPNGTILKTEDVHFKSVQANGSQTVAVKKSSRGVKVSYKITRIESKQVGSSTAALQP